jgi:putative colanic acid biosynthesis acetyltransferase WcaF
MSDSDFAESGLKPTVQNLSKFTMPRGFRGRSAWQVQLWWLVQSTLFRWSPQVAYPFRAWLLRLFGARVGRNTVIRPSVQITYPWKVSLADRVWLGDEVVLYSLGEITIGHDSVISQRSYICAGDHDYQDVRFSIRGRPVSIGNQVWVATDCFLAPGVKIGDGSVIGARSSVFCDQPPGRVCLGTPCRPIRAR